MVMVLVVVRVLFGKHGPGTSHTLAQYEDAAEVPALATQLPIDCAGLLQEPPRRNRAPMSKGVAMTVGVRRSLSNNLDERMAGLWVRIVRVVQNFPDRRKMSKGDSREAIIYSSTVIRSFPISIGRVPRGDGNIPDSLHNTSKS